MMPSLYEIQGEDTYSAIIEDDKHGQCLAAPKTGVQDLVDLAALQDGHAKVAAHQGFFMKTMELYTQRVEQEEEEEDQEGRTIPENISFPADVSVSAADTGGGGGDDSLAAPTSAPTPTNNATLVLEFLLEKQRQEKVKKRSLEQSQQESSPLAFLLNKQRQDRSKKPSLEQSQHERSPLAFLLNKQRQQNKSWDQMQEDPVKDSLINMASAMKFLAEDRSFTVQEEEEEEEEERNYQEETYCQQPLTKRNRVSFTNSEYAEKDACDDEDSER